MSLTDILLALTITLLVTIALILVAGSIFLYFIIKKFKSQSFVAPGPGVSIRGSANSTLVQVRKIAWLMDSSIPIGGGHSIGLDGIVDLIPGLGDIAGVLVSAYIIYRAAACGAPQPVLMRMAGNVLIDALLGAFPILGAIADSAFKANIRNVAILEKFLAEQERAADKRAGIIDIHP
ncbi:MAG: DUF4112 domain-containing protein [Acidobacteriota bacterium]|nr:DUF4112 domain-containing protein [Acidobacteriota bacterium]